MKKLHVFFSAVAVMAAITISISSCKKKNENHAPVITIDEPADNEMVMLPDSVHIEGTATDDNSLHEMSILVISNATNDTVFAEYPMVHDLTTYDFHYHFHPTVAGSYKLHVTAEDHDEAKTEKVLTIDVM